MLTPIRVALTQLRVWAPDSHKKLDEALVQELKKLPEEKALQTLHELPQVKRVIKRQNPNAFHLPALIKTAQETLQVSAQVDSGCTRSMIDRSYAKRNGLNIQPLAIPLEVEGCNSTVLDHVDGKVEACLAIGGHVETVTLWTMDLSEDSQVILGYDWLQGHNPTIDWKMGTCSFDSCSGRCLERWDPNLGKGGKLFAMNVQGYLKKVEPWSIGRTRKPKQIFG